MVFVYKRYYNIHRIALRIIGLWPYQSSIVSRIQATLYLTVCFFSIIFQLTKYTTTTYNIMLIIEYLSYLLASIICVINYNSFYFNTKAIKQALEHIKLDWDTLTDSGEIKILIKYAYVIYMFTQVTYVIIGLVVVIFILLECSPVILDVLAPRNVSRPRTVVLYEFFIDKERYFFFYIICEILALAIEIVTMVAIGTLLLAIGSHVCAEFKLSSDLIRNIVTDRTLQIPASQRTYFMYRNIRRAVQIHRRASKFLSDLLSALHVWYFFLILIVVTSLSCNLFLCLYALTRLNDIYELFRYLVALLCHLICIFIGNFAGQVITDHSKEMLNATYDTLWYVAPLPIQKLLLIIQKCAKDQKLIIGSIYIASLEGFSVLVTSAISYFTVMYNTMTKY